MGQHIDYLLVPDAGLARRLRRALVEEKARIGVLVGTFGELVEYARDSYLLPEPASLEREFLYAEMANASDAFWSGSFAIAPDDTCNAVNTALNELLSAVGPSQNLQDLNVGALSDRVTRHLTDLVLLAKSLKGKLPRQLAITRELLATDRDEALRHIVVYCVEGLQHFSPWQQALVEKLNLDAQGEPVPELVELLQSTAFSHTKSASPTALHTLQSRLFETPGHKGSFDESVQFVGVRDFLQEAEVAAGMVQQLLKSDASLVAADIGLLVPDSYEYAIALESAFRNSGLALSGLPQETWRKDLGREALYHYLYCLQKPSPAMALAVCLSSPLMPWTLEEGGRLAQSVMDGDYKLRPLHGMSKDGRAMLSLIKEGAESPSQVAKAIESFVSLISVDEPMREHFYRLKEGAGVIVSQLQSLSTVEWTSLRQLVTPHYITDGDETVYTLEGVTVWREGKEPWRPVKHGIVLGFEEGRYPKGVSRSPVFTSDEWQEIKASLGMMVETPSEKMHQQRARFKRQLGAVTDSVTLLIPRKSPSGDARAPSDTYIFMQQLFEEEVTRIKEVDVGEDRQGIRHLALASETTPTPAREWEIADLDLGHDLLALRVDEKGEQKPESPSSLETLMVSGLAWLLRRLNAEPSGWEPEGTNVMLLGSLAHKVFEDLFPAGESLPDRDEVDGGVGKLLDKAILEMAPFLRGVQWHVERRNLENGILKAALAWRDILATLGAEVLGSEVWLKGKLGDIAIHGQADQLVALPGDRLLVVDYKRSSSTSRRPRMNNGYDSQASLYRTMLETDGLKSGQSDSMKDRLKSATQIGIVYYMMNDQVSLADNPLTESARIPGWESITENISEHAIALIKTRLEEVKAGRVRLNRESDTDFFDKTAGIKPYALGNTPLVGLFSLPDDAGEML